MSSLAILKEQVNVNKNHISRLERDIRHHVDTIDKLRTQITERQNSVEDLQAAIVILEKEDNK